MFGREINMPNKAHWGARAIYEKYAVRGTEKFEYGIDLLHDRQSVDGEMSKEFSAWLNKVALPWLRKEVARVDLGTYSDKILVLDEGDFRLEASPNASYGYLYIGAIEKDVVPSE